MSSGRTAHLEILLDVSFALKALRGREMALCVNSAKYLSHAMSGFAPALAGPRKSSRPR
jgi:hypothetical protein